MFRLSLKRATLCAAFFALVITASLASPAQEKPATSAIRTRIEEVMKGAHGAHFVGAVSVSPDGHFVEWSEGQGKIRIIALSSTGELGLTKEDKGRVISAGDNCSVGSIIWAPDSKRIAFLAACEKNPQQNLFLSSIDADTKPQRITDLKGFVEAPAFSPDGKHIAFLYVEGASRPSGALAAMKPPSGVIGEDGLEIQRVAVANADADSPQPVEFATPEKLHVYEFDWRHDSQALAFIAADPPGENNWWVAKLYSIDLTSKVLWPKVVLAPAEVSGPLHGLQIAVPRWSPDGTSIAFIGGLMSDQGSTGGDLWIISAKGGQPRDLTSGRPTSPVWLEWSDNDHIYLTEESAGNQQLVRLHLTGPLAADGVNFGSPIFTVPASIGDGRMKMSLSSTADHSLFVFAASSYEHPPEIYGVRPGSGMGSSGGFAGLMQLSHFNDTLTPAWGKVTSLHWKNEGLSVQGWLFEPKGYDATRDAGKKFPMIVLVHGGPSASAESRWGMGGMSGTLFSALGYFVLEANPRGSFGQGETFTAANRKDFGYGDLRDILAGVDTVLAKYPVDEKRIGLAGWSYGGFMTMFAVTQTQRFRAAVAGAGIANWQSYYGENSIDQWMIPFFGASVYDDPAVYAKSSAITFIHQVHTPTLVVVGDRDGECPSPQSYEFWHALRDQHVKTQLVIYPNEGHAFSDPEHRKDVIIRTVDWFETEMSP